MTQDPSCDFDQVVFDSHEQYPCSPRFEEFSSKHQGIRINAPAKVRVDFEDGAISPASRIPLCITMQFFRSYFVKFDNLHSHITVVLTNKKTGRSYSGNLGPSQAHDPMPPDDLPPERQAVRFGREFFNVNIVDYVALPAEKATYFVHATLEDHKSNVLTIDVR